MNPKQLDYLCRRARAKPRNAKWLTVARQFAHERGIVVADVLDMHDHLADIAEWDGMTRAAAEEHAWAQVVAIFDKESAA